MCFPTTDSNSRSHVLMSSFIRRQRDDDITALRNFRELPTRPSMPNCSAPRLTHSSVPSAAFFSSRPISQVWKVRLSCSWLSDGRPSYSARSVLAMMTKTIVVVDIEAVILPWCRELQKRRWFTHLDASACRDSTQSSHSFQSRLDKVNNICPPHWG